MRTDAAAVTIKRWVCASKVVAALPPFWCWQGPSESRARFRAPKGRNPPFGLAPQAPRPFRKRHGHAGQLQGPLALVSVLAMGVALGSGVSLWMAAPGPAAYACGLDCPPGAGDVPVQAP